MNRDQHVFMSFTLHLISLAWAYGSSRSRWISAALCLTQLQLLWTRCSSSVFITDGQLDVVLPTLPASVLHNHLLTSLDKCRVSFCLTMSVMRQYNKHSDVNSHHLLRPKKDHSLLFLLLSKQISLSSFFLRLTTVQANTCEHRLWKSIEHSECNQQKDSVNECKQTSHRDKSKKQPLSCNEEIVSC